ncbi:MAG: polyhydroxyalkanoate synthesis repressor PhaR [Gammaproteobacteria bacterium]|nr:polyhydroxyalkanoate synthesis repressor PhaR [Gammaproteobacteria bacterium]
MPTERLIKKYPNRRLYDTSTSKYITLDDVREMVVQDVPFKVVEKKTNEDITRNILLQIIMEQESGNGEPMFSVDLLMRFIQNYGENSQADFSDFMEKSLQFFADQQEMIHAQLTKPLKNTPGEIWLDMGKKQMDAWQDMQKQFFESLAGGGKK